MLPLNAWEPYGNNELNPKPLNPKPWALISMVALRISAVSAGGVRCVALLLPAAAMPRNMGVAVRMWKTSGTLAVYLGFKV